MPPHIAIPQSRSNAPEYVAKVMPYYLEAIRLAGGEPVEIALDLEPEEIARVARACDAVLLPGNPADVNPEKYGASREPHTADEDPLRDNVDELLLQDAFSLRKPILGICYGLQSLNVWRTGSLRQHLATSVRHTNEPGASGSLPEHAVVIDPASKLAQLLAAYGPQARGGSPEVHGEPAKVLEITVNSSHHQAALRPGDGLKSVAWCRQDHVIEALEGTAPEHWVLAVQWHPERMLAAPSAQALFRAFTDAARSKH